MTRSRLRKVVQEEQVNSHNPLCYVTFAQSLKWNWLFFCPSLSAAVELWGVNIYHRKGKIRVSVPPSSPCVWLPVSLTTCLFLQPPQFVDIELEDEEDSSDEEYCPDDEEYEEEEEDEDIAEEVNIFFDIWTNFHQLLWPLTSVLLFFRGHQVTWAPPVLLLSAPS